MWTQADAGAAVRRPKAFRYRRLPNIADAQLAGRVLQQIHPLVEPDTAGVVRQVHAASHGKAGQQHENEDEHMAHAAHSLCLGALPGAYCGGASIAI
ncbi:hypothetical protein D3C80_1015840 [compost metagenome]